MNSVIIYKNSCQLPLLFFRHFPVYNNFLAIFTVSPLFIKKILQFLIIKKNNLWWTFQKCIVVVFSGIEIITDKL